MSEPVVLCYHAIGESWPAAVAPARLREHVALLLGRGYAPMTFAGVVTAPRPVKAFAVTFDDAYASVVERAFPVLAELGVPATVFAVTSFADDGRPLEWPGLLESGVSATAESRAGLTWDQLGRLADSGWEVGSHTVTHPRLTELDDGELEAELRDSRAAFARALGEPCRSIAYPYGAVDDRVARAAAAAGYEAGCSLSILTSGSLAWPRIGVYGVDSPTRFRLKVSPTVLRVRRALARMGVGR
jgi:peptidoglycan/xylan/chitin deacetylase (PgdA/CDA1 family)